MRQAVSVGARLEGKGHDCAYIFGKISRYGLVMPFSGMSEELLICIGPTILLVVLTVLRRVACPGRPQHIHRLQHGQ